MHTCIYNIDAAAKLKKVLCNKRILFVTTKNLDYIRNHQEIRLFEEYAKDYVVVGSTNNVYLYRICYVLIRLLLLSVRNFDIVFIGFLPQLLLPFVGFKFSGKCVIVDFFFSLYDSMVFDRKYFSDSGIMSRIVKALDNITLKKADFVVCDTQAHAHYFVTDFGVNIDKIIVLYLEANRNIYSPDIAVEKGSLKNCKTILYFGTMLPLQGIETVLEAASLLCEHSDLHFVLIGPIKKNLLKKYQFINTITFIKWLPQDDLAKKIATADLCLAGHFNKEIEKAKRTIPGKAVIFAAMNKPMILGDSPANREIYCEQADKRIFVEMGNSKELANNIVEFFKSKKTGETSE